MRHLTLGVYLPEKNWTKLRKRSSRNCFSKTGAVTRRSTMSTVRKQDAHRALELLEEYHSQLSKPQDRALRNAIERVIRIFKSRLFQALLDIQEFYEVTLLDESKTLQQKTIETLQVKDEIKIISFRNSIISSPT